MSGERQVEGGRDFWSMFRVLYPEFWAGKTSRGQPGMAVAGLPPSSPNELRGRKCRLGLLQAPKWILGSRDDHRPTSNANTMHAFAHESSYLGSLVPEKARPLNDEQQLRAALQVRTLSAVRYIRFLFRRNLFERTRSPRERL